MANKNIFTALEKDKESLASTKSKEINASMLFAGDERPEYNNADLPVLRIPLELITERNVNEFDMNQQTITLENSIEAVGLINPVSLMEYKEGHYYTIAGNRRLHAYRNIHQKYLDLHAEEPDNPIYAEKAEFYSEIPSFVYRPGTTEEKEKDPSVLTPEDEQTLYADSNLESRQISKQEAFTQIDYLIGKIQTNEQSFRELYKNRAKELRSTKGYKTRYNVDTINRADLISDVLTNDFKIKGFSSVTVFRYLRIKETDPEMAKAVREGYPVKKAYEELFSSEEKKTKSFSTQFRQFQKNRTFISKNLSSFSTEELQSLTNEVSLQMKILEAELKTRLQQ